MIYASRRDYEAEAMSVYSLIFAFLLLMLVVKNPFELIWNAFPADLLKTGPIPPGVTNIAVLDAVKGLWAQSPAEGKGLNPLLQNYWMVIHPQILFTGFSSMAVPYTLAVAAMLKRDYSSWIRVATPWAVFGSMILGTGIIMGGYWAYETLGWGGFWGWDPVENSSLIPWLLCTASIHTALNQRKTGAFVKTNFVFSLLTFMTVLYRYVPDTEWCPWGYLGSLVCRSRNVGLLAASWVHRSFRRDWLWGLLPSRSRNAESPIAAHSALPRSSHSFWVRLH